MDNTVPSFQDGGFCPVGEKVLTGPMLVVWLTPRAGQ